MGEDWIYLSKGSFNTAFKNKAETEVLKVAVHASGPSAAYDAPERAIRLWKEINPDLQPEPYLTTYRDKSGNDYPAWVCPFVHGRQANDNEISQKLIEIYNRTGRIVIDGFVQSNFITKPNGQTICIDIGLALQLQAQHENQLQRRYSITSSDAWQNHFRKQYYITYYKQELKCPNTINTTQALLFIKKYRPDINDVSFLSTNKSLRERLSEAYILDYEMQEDMENQGFSHNQIDVQKAQELLQKIIPSKEKVNQAIQYLDEKYPSNFESTKMSCIKEIEHYLNSRGKIVQGKFKPTLITRIFRDRVITEMKVGTIEEFKHFLKETISYEELLHKFDELENFLKRSDTRFAQGKGLKNCIYECIEIISKARNADLKQSNLAQL